MNVQKGKGGGAVQTPEQHTGVRAAAQHIGVPEELLQHVDRVVIEMNRRILARGQPLPVLPPTPLNLVAADNDEWDANLCVLVLRHVCEKTTEPGRCSCQDFMGWYPGGVNGVRHSTEKRLAEFVNDKLYGVA